MKEPYWIELKSGREKSLNHFHPWIFSGAIGKTSEELPKGCSIEIRDSKGNPLALGLYNSRSQIRVRAIIYSLNDLKRPVSICLEENIKRALDRRLSWFPQQSTTAFRLIFSEGDDVPGLVLDKFGSLLVMQLETESMESRRDWLVDILWKEVTLRWPDVNTLWERSTSDGRAVEGLSKIEKIHRGENQGPWQFYENDYLFQYPSLNQKTGYYLDQRDNRRTVASFAKGRRVLDVCSYTGSFSRYALEEGASFCRLVDVSKEVLEQGAQALKRAGFSNFETHCQSAGDYLREEKDLWDLIVLDPPKLVPSKKHLSKGLRAYKDLNLQAIKRLNPGGILASYSCSGLVSSDELLRQISWAAKDAGRSLQIIGELHQPQCHPWLTGFPEGKYLKGYLLSL